MQVDPVVAGVHITSPVATSPLAYFGGWRCGIAEAKDRMESLAEDADCGAVAVAGDFNSTPDMRQFRDLLTDGYCDAVDQTGAGFTPTFPSYFGFPPLIPIDHVLTRHAAVSSIETIFRPRQRSSCAASHHTNTADKAFMLSKRLADSSPANTEGFYWNPGQGGTRAFHPGTPDAAAGVGDLQVMRFLGLQRSSDDTAIPVDKLLGT